MYDTSGTHSVCDGRTFDWRHTHARLTWLSAEIARHEGERRLGIISDYQAQAVPIEHYVSTREAFALLGALLGLLPPAAIFWRLFGYGLSGSSASVPLFALCLVMNGLCFLCGRMMGAHLAPRASVLGHRSWTLMLFLAILIGALWGVATGALGGLIFFGFGAFFGGIVAAPVGAVAFALFTPLHRLLARDGMIDARQLWPLALGVSATIAALILGL